MQQFMGSRLSDRRRALGLSRERVAVEVGRSFNTIGEYERGGVAPPADVLGALASVLRCSVADFFESDKVLA